MEAQALDINLDKLGAEARECEQCQLSTGRTNVVFGEGSPDAAIMFVGEGPGEVEDRTGRPFVGPAGQKLTEVLQSVKLARESVYITNMVKCQPPRNRVPARAEIETCWDWLAAQIGLIRPLLIVTLGNTPSQRFLGASEGIGQLRGKFYRWKGDIEVFPMFHPSYLLRNPSKSKGSPKHLTWLDIQAVVERISLLRSRNRGS
ncbi:MAG: uracil-DNA glycosylase [Candidatus Bipolaricaulota bacterium]